jgi:tRNA modification GTPase
LDEALGVFFRGPKSYTTEDTVEVQAHGGPAVARRILESALGAGCRLAMPGEFTKRAFLGGRLDLSQAEAIADMIAAQSDQELRLAMGALRGGLAGRLKQIRAALVEALAAVEACLDFPEEVEDISSRDLGDSLQGGVLDPLHEILEEGRKKLVFMQDGVVVICGRPNVGKSSLFNAMLGTDRAIVTSMPGTTRDAIEERIMSKGAVIRLVDTAGIDQGRDEIEALGINGTKERLKYAHAALVVVDGSREISPLDREVFELTKDLKRILAVNKRDKGLKWSGEALAGMDCPRLNVSAKTGEGVNELIDMLGEIITQGAPEPVPGEAAVNQRQAGALERCTRAVEEALLKLRVEEPEMELVSLEMEEGLRFLGQVDGKGAPEEVIDAVFSNFCVGK